MNPQELFQFLFLMSQALNSTIINVSTTCGFPLSAVNLYEVVELLGEDDKPILDAKGKPTFVPQITLSSGKEIDLTPKQNNLFRPIWNKKIDVDDKLRACINAMDAAFFPANQQ